MLLWIDLTDGNIRFFEDHTIQGLHGNPLVQLACASWDDETRWKSSVRIVYRSWREGLGFLPYQIRHRRIPPELLGHLTQRHQNLDHRIGIDRWRRTTVRVLRHWESQLLRGQIRSHRGRLQL